MKYINSFKGYQLIIENLDQAKSYLKKNNISYSDPKFLQLKSLLKNHLGYIGWFTKMLYEKNVLMQDLTNLFNIIVNESEIIDGLPKQVINYDDWEKLVDDIISTRQNIQIKRVLNELPTLQKSFINIKNKTEKELLIKLFKLKDRTNFFKKISRYKTKKELLDAIKLFTSDKRSIGYTNIKKIVEASDAKIIYDSPFFNIIICEVDYVQLRKLASNTSWCIVRSESTFNSYANGIGRQYIIFLTDKDDNYSKIGITYGIKFVTAHLKNDSYIDEKSIENILDERGTSVNILKLSMDEILKSPLLKKAAVSTLISYGFKKSDIIKFKKIYTKSDIKQFTEEEITSNNLKDKLEIVENDIDWNTFDFDFLIKNKDRIVFKVEKYMLIDRLSIIDPKKIKQLIDLDLLDDDTLLFINYIEKYKNEILDHLHEIVIYEDLVYVLKYCNINNSNTNIIDILKNIKNRSLKKYYSEKIVKEFIKLGFKFDEREICEILVSKFEVGYNSNYYNTWLPMIEFMPGLLDVVKDSIHENLRYKNGLGISYRQDLMNMSQTSKELIKKYYGDIYEETISLIDLLTTRKQMKCVLPHPNQSLGRESDEYMKKMGRSNYIITPRQLYSDFYEILKDDSWKSGREHGTDIIPTLYMIFALCKIGKYNEIGKLNIHWTPEFTGKVIRQALNNFTYNGKSYVHESFLLEEKERVKLFEYLLMNIKDIIKPGISNLIINDIELMRHEVFSLVYYLYDWGFNRYCDLVKNSENVYEEKWEVIDGKNSVLHTSIRAQYFTHIFNYLNREKSKRENIEEIKNLIDKIMSWKMTKTELKYTEHFLVYLFYYNNTEELYDYIFGKYFPVNNRKKYKKNQW